MTTTTTDRHLRRTAASSLRKLADYIERHEITDEEIVDAGTNGWTLPRLFVYIEVARRLLPGRTLTFDKSGYAKTVDDGVEVTVALRVVRQECELVL